MELKTACCMDKLLCLLFLYCLSIHCTLCFGIARFFFYIIIIIFFLARIQLEKLGWNHRVLSRQGDEVEGDDYLSFCAPLIITLHLCYMIFYHQSSVVGDDEAA